MPGGAGRVRGGVAGRVRAAGRTEHDQYHPAVRAQSAGAQPPYLHPDYGSTVKRAPTHPPIRLEHTLSEVTGPGFADGWAGPDATDLTRRHQGEPLGERIIVAGRVLDEDGRPVPGTLVEMWQCNAAGRYHHPVDQHDAPLDPNFTGVGQVVTAERGEYRFLTIKPGAYPWRNTPNAWRPAHIHFGVFGPGFATRLMTQMYFPGDPLLAFDPIYHRHARHGGARAAGLRLRPGSQRGRMGARLPLRHRAARPRGDPDGAGLTWPRKLIPTPSQTVGPFFHLALDRPGMGRPDAQNPRGERIVIEGRVIDGDGAAVADACSKCGRPTPPAATTIPTTRGPTSRSTRIFAASAGSRPMPRAAFVSSRSGPARCRAAATRCRRRTSTSRSLPAAC